MSSATDAFASAGAAASAEHVPLVQRPHPYPYAAMFALCSDLDETPDADTYFETARFLNTHSPTRMGEGVGLEVGNSLYFNMPAGQFSYFNCTDEDRNRIHALIGSGHIDCLHSFGDLASSREHVQAAWSALRERNQRLEVWIDHALAPTNFDPDIMRGTGALPGTPAYHADISLANGLRYIWKGRVTSVIAKEAPLSLRGIYSARHRTESLRTLAKEAAKILAASLGSEKYAMHTGTSLMRHTTLADGAKITEFLRSNPCWGGVSHSETADGLTEVLTPAALDRLVSAGGKSIFYTHLGKTRADVPIPPASVAGLKLLARFAQERQILVTTTRRLLGFCDAQQSVTWSARRSGNTLQMTLSSLLPLHDLQGLTWWVDQPPETALVSINAAPPTALQLNPPDASGRASLTIPWQPLRWPNELEAA